MLGCFGGRLWATCAAFHRKVVVLDAVMYLYCKGLLWLGRIPNRNPRLECNEHSCRTTQMVAAMGHSCGVITSQKKGIFTPFCLFFCVHQQMHTEMMVGNRCMGMSGMGISPLRKNSKSSAMKLLVVAKARR